ncbi:MAG: OmpA family protein [Alphaproteobacteria bacterium]|nr:OmpA family protein [Alphaproteobacteria bacterium]
MPLRPAVFAKIARSLLVAAAATLFLGFAADAQAKEIVIGDAGVTAKQEDYLPSPTATAPAPTRSASEGWPWNVPIKQEDWGIGAKAREKFEETQPKHRYYPYVKQEAPEGTGTLRPPVMSGGHDAPADQQISQGLRDTLQDAGASTVRPLFAPSAAPTELKAFDETGKCVEQRVTWIKRCAEIGYPSTFTGQVRGETRVICPEGTLKDSWLSNSCNPPGMMEEAGAQPAATPDAPAPASTITDAATGDVLPLAVLPQNTQNRQAQPMMPYAAEAAGQMTGLADGQCGFANNSVTNAAPIEGLCNSGAPGAVTGEGPWRWSCGGTNGGMAVNCAALPPGSTPAVAASGGTDGVCGPAHNAGAITAPSTNLCAAGEASEVNGKGPWFWACSGINGGKPMACQAVVRVDGACGAADAVGSKDRPADGLCLRGAPGPVTGTGPWSWTCAGEYGGTAAQCSANVSVDAVCGSAADRGATLLPISDLCREGQASEVKGTGPWTWVCSGFNGGKPAQCRTLVSIDGICGAANGKPANMKPASGLCAGGDASSVAGNGPWEWNCTGMNGGMNVSCIAPYVEPAPAVQEPLLEEPPAQDTEIFEPLMPQESMPERVPEFIAPGEPAASEPHALNTPPEMSANEPALAPEAPVHEEMPVMAQSHDEPLPALPEAPEEVPAAAKTTVSEAAPAPEPADTYYSEADELNARARRAYDAGKQPGFIEAYEEPAPKTAAAEASEPAVAEMTVAPVQQDVAVPPAPEPVTAMQESPEPAAMPVAPVAEEPAPVPPPVVAAAPVVAGGTCGSATEKARITEPKKDLCAEGTAGYVEGDGPWHWTCTNDATGGVTNCVAPVPVLAYCGAAAEKPAGIEPVKDLCAQGTPRDMEGNGPWTWACDGGAGGMSVTCSAEFDAALQPTEAMAHAQSAPVAPVSEGEFLPPTMPARLAVNGQCGKAAGVATKQAPQTDLCDAGGASSVVGEGPWNWVCEGTDGGEPTPCTAPLAEAVVARNEPKAGAGAVNGLCGKAHGIAHAAAPSGDLCAYGNPTSVDGDGPWGWTCEGIDGGSAVGCVALRSGGSGESLVTPTLGQPAPEAMPATDLTTPKLAEAETASLPPLPPAPAPDMPVAPVTTNNIAPGVSNYAPAEPIRSLAQPEPAIRSGVVAPRGAPIRIDADLSSIAFEGRSDELTEEGIVTAAKVARLLVNNPGSRIQVTAYAANNNDVSTREARRISLARALAVRNTLIGQGVDSSRIDVRAMGANVPSGEPDRVDLTSN